MKRILPLALLIAVVAALVWMGCDDDTVAPKTGLRVSGIVYAYICTEPNPANQSIDPRYSIETGRPAQVTFTRIDSVHDQDDLLTDANSAFSVYLEPGLWRATVETDHSYPDVFDSLQLSEDTVLWLSIRYDFADPDTLLVSYEYVLEGPGNYWDPDDSTFTRWIDTLDADAGGGLKTSGARCFVDTVASMNRVYLMFAVPLEHGVRMCDVLNAVTDGLYRYRGNLAEKYPDNMSVSVRRYGLCPEDFGIDSTDYPLPESLSLGYDPPE